MEEHHESLTKQIEGLLDTNNDLRKQLQDTIQASSDFESIANSVIKKQEDAMNLYDGILGSGQLIGGLLSLSEKGAIKSEIGKAKHLFNLGLRTKSPEDLTKVLTPSLFNNLLSKLRESCPTITPVLETLVMSPYTTRNTIKTPQLKMKAALHLLSSLMDVRDQRGNNDLPILFGLLSMSYGAGTAKIRAVRALPCVVS